MKTPTDPKPVSNITIRNPLVQDADDWRRLWDGYLAFYQVQLPSDVSTQTWQRVLDKTSKILGRVLDINGHLAGLTISVLHEGTWTTRPILYLEDLFVDPQHRGRGLGHTLLTDALQQGRARECSSVYWHTRADNATARRLYDQFSPADNFVRYRMKLS